MTVAARRGVVDGPNRTGAGGCAGVGGGSPGIARAHRRPLWPSGARSGEPWPTCGDCWGRWSARMGGISHQEPVGSGDDCPGPWRPRCPLAGWPETRCTARRAKQEVGLDEYEVRRWTGWYRHITSVSRHGAGSGPAGPCLSGRNPGSAAQIWGCPGSRPSQMTLE